jgi:hypothetical protein
MNDQYTPLLVYCNAIGLPPLASRPARTALLSPVGPEGYLALQDRVVLVQTQAAGARPCIMHVSVQLESPANS